MTISVEPEQEGGGAAAGVHTVREGAVATNGDGAVVHGPLLRGVASDVELMRFSLSCCRPVLCHRGEPAGSEPNRMAGTPPGVVSRCEERERMGADICRRQEERDAGPRGCLQPGKPRGARAQGRAAAKGSREGLARMAAPGPPQHAGAGPSSTNHADDEAAAAAELDELQMLLGAGNATSHLDFLGHALHDCEAPEELARREMLELASNSGLFAATVAAEFFPTFRPSFAWSAAGRRAASRRASASGTA